MRLGAALAVIKYNDGYQVFKEVFEAVGVTPEAYLLKTFRKLDKERVYRSLHITRNQQRRFAKKQPKGWKVNSQVQKHGSGYAFGKYTSDQRDVDSEAEDVPPVESDADPDPLSPNTRLADSRDICSYTEDEGIVGIGPGISFPHGDIGWVQCDKCLKWFHLLCLGVEEEDLTEDDWNLNECLYV